MHKILLVINDTDKRLQISRFLTNKNYGVTGMDSGQTAIRWMKRNKPDIVLCDIKLDDMTGIQFLGRVKETYPLTVVIFTGDNNVTDAAEVLMSGAYDYIKVPLFPDAVLDAIKKILPAELKATAAPITYEIKAKKAEGHGAYNGQYIIGNSLGMVEIVRQVALVAPTNFSVIIYGKSGSGKEVIAQQIHRKSKRADKPFVAIDCGALSKELSGSELFGHEKGSFTGAINQKIGSLEMANGGTIFLDEIGNLPYEIQVSLLRVVQERIIKRVGGTKDISIDVRIIIASNVNLLDAASAGKFREDLYHRFNEFTIELPSLNERKQDIMLFAHHFLQTTNIELGKCIKGFTNEAESMLMNYAWYGNIRELKNVIRRITLLTNGDIIEARSLPFEISNFFTQQFGTSVTENTDLIKEITKSGTQFFYKVKAKNENFKIRHRGLRVSERTASFA